MRLIEKSSGQIRYRRFQVVQRYLRSVVGEHHVGIALFLATRFTGCSATPEASNTPGTEFIPEDRVHTIVKTSGTKVIATASEKPTSLSSSFIIHPSYAFLASTPPTYTARFLGLVMSLSHKPVSVSPPTNWSHDQVAAALRGQQDHLHQAPSFQDPRALQYYAHSRHSSVSTVSTTPMATPFHTPMQQAHLASVAVTPMPRPTQNDLDIVGFYDKHDALDPLPDITDFELATLGPPQRITDEDMAHSLNNMIVGGFDRFANVVSGLANGPVEVITMPRDQVPWDLGAGGAELSRRAAEMGWVTPTSLQSQNNVPQPKEAWDPDREKPARLLATPFAPTLVQPGPLHHTSTPAPTHSRPLLMHVAASLDIHSAHMPSKTTSPTAYEKPTVDINTGIAESHSSPQSATSTPPQKRSSPVHVPGKAPPAAPRARHQPYPSYDARKAARANKTNMGPPPAATPRVTPFELTTPSPATSSPATPTIDNVVAPRQLFPQTPHTYPAGTTFWEVAVGTVQVAIPGKQPYNMPYSGPQTPRPQPHPRPNGGPAPTQQRVRIAHAPAAAPVSPSPVAHSQRPVVQGYPANPPQMVIGFGTEDEYRWRQFRAESPAAYFDMLKQGKVAAHVYEYETAWKRQEELPPQNLPVVAGALGLQLH